MRWYGQGGLQADRAYAANQLPQHMNVKAATFVTPLTQHKTGAVHEIKSLHVAGPVIEHIALAGTSQPAGAIESFGIQDIGLHPKLVVISNANLNKLGLDPQLATMAIRG